MSEAFRASVTRTLFPAILVLPALHLIMAGVAGGGQFLLALLLIVPFLALGQLVLATLALLQLRNLREQPLSAAAALSIVGWYAAVVGAAVWRAALLPLMLVSIPLLALSVLRLGIDFASKAGSVRDRLRASAAGAFRRADEAPRVPEWEQPGASRVYFSAASSAGRAHYARRKAGSVPRQTAADAPVQLGELVLVED